MPRKLRFLSVFLTMFGVLLINSKVGGETLRIFGSISTAFGIGLFFTQHLVTSHQTQKSVESIESKLDALHQTQKSVESIESKLDALFSGLGQEQTLIKALLNTLATTRTVDPLVNTFGSTLHHLFDHIPSFSDALESVRKGDTRKIDEIDFIDNFVETLAEKLPNGSAWLGVSQLIDPMVWTGKKNGSHINVFRNVIRRRSNNGELKVMRVYMFANQNACDSMKEVIKKDRENGLKIGVDIGVRDNPHDISVLYLPNPGHKVEIDIKGNEFKVRNVSQKFALKFVVESMRLRSLEMFVDDAAQKWVDHFEADWTDAVEVTDSLPPEDPAGVVP